MKCGKGRFGGRCGVILQLPSCEVLMYGIEVEGWQLFLKEVLALHSIPKHCNGCFDLVCRLIRTHVLESETYASE